MPRLADPVVPAYPLLQLDKQLCFALYAATTAVTRACGNCR